MSMLLLGVGSDAWTPARLSGLAPSLSVALQRSRGLLWQDTGKTVVAVAATDPVRVATCPWTGVDYTAPSDAARPLLYDEGSGKWSLSFDGVDDRMTASGGPTSATARTSAWSVLTPASGSPVLFQVGTPTTNGSMDRTFYFVGTPKVALQGHFSDIDPAWATSASAAETGIWYHAATSKYAKNGGALSSSSVTVSAGDGLVWLGSSSVPGSFWTSRIRGLVLANGTQTDATLALLQAYTGTL